MPHSPQEKKKAITRLRRIQGQAAALERAVEAGTECGLLLQQMAALRGAVNGLMSEVLEGHLRETFGGNDKASSKAMKAGVDDVLTLIRSYLK